MTAASQPVEADVPPSLSARADDVRTRLRMLGTQTGNAHSRFAWLYARVTERWLDYLLASRQPEFGARLIVHFYELYDLYVTRVAEGRGGRPVRHWADYLAVATRTPASSKGLGPAIANRRLLSRAIYAHVRYDLGEAIALAWFEHEAETGAPPDLEEIRDVLLSPESSASFIGAAGELTAARTDVTRFLLPSLVQSLRARYIWVPVLQRWRRAAWKDALAAIETRTPIRRD